MIHKTKSIPEQHGVLWLEVSQCVGSSRAFIQRRRTAAGAERRRPSVRCESSDPVLASHSFSERRTTAPLCVSGTCMCCSGSPPASPGSNTHLSRWAETWNRWRHWFGQRLNSTRQDNGTVYAVCEILCVCLLICHPTDHHVSRQYSLSCTVVPHRSWPNIGLTLCRGWPPRLCPQPWALKQLRGGQNGEDKNNNFPPKCEMLENGWMEPLQNEY